MRTLLVLATLAALTACGGGSDRDSRSDRDSSRSERDRGDRADRDRDNRSSDDREDRARDVDPRLEEELVAEARAARTNLPRSVGAGATLEDIEARDNELIFSFRTTFALDESRIGDMRRAERENMCRQAQTRDWFQRGANFEYRITDGDDEEHSFSYDSCPSSDE